jgi:uncharacterized glyoxalase superfamily protein PhnB
MRLHTYLNYGGDCEQAFRFYEKHLGGKATTMMTQAEQPNAKDVRPDQKDAILYARMSIGQTDLMGSDVPSERFQPMRSVYPSLSLDSIDGSRAHFRPTFRRRRDLHAVAGDVLRFPVRDATRQVWNVLDDHQRTSPQSI